MQGSEVRRSGKKTGRPRDIEIKDLPERYRKVKSFLEHNWGLFSLDLKRVQEPEEVRTIFRQVQGVEWMPSFREHAVCLIADALPAPDSKELRMTRKKLKDARVHENRCWSDYNDTHPSATEAINALRQSIAGFNGVLEFFPFFAVLSILAVQLRVAELNQRSTSQEKAAREAQQDKVRLEEDLRAYEADFARKEIVRFVNENDRADRTLVNFARVIAGLPEWRWLHSIRECKKLGLGPSTPEYAYQLFLRLKVIVRGMKLPKVESIEKRLREELLNPDCDPMLRGYADMHWPDLYDAIYSCRNVTRGELPDRIMGRFVVNVQKPKYPLDIQLRKLQRLVPLKD